MDGNNELNEMKEARGLNWLILNTVYCVKNFIINAIYLIGHLTYLKLARSLLKYQGDAIWNLDLLDDWIKHTFYYKREKIDKRFWVINFAMAGWMGDCDDIAGFACWWARKHGYKAEYWSIFPEKGSGHAVCIVNNNGLLWLVDNRGVKRFTSFKTHFHTVKWGIKRWW